MAETSPLDDLSAADLIAAAQRPAVSSLMARAKMARSAGRLGMAEQLETRAMALLLHELRKENPDA